ncbi:MAG: nucleotidyl transferase AbiEii/AbiGii toxin family protein [Candidatus Kerfeldbacteria bacterium]|nr:nucleotidyl transferase AbiEii/AbiGii toxin family protein [Candidatus Kerfeldbacteria bacterium]
MTTDYSKHKALLLYILKDVYSDTTLATCLGFKGGTAALLFYGLNRDSVDLDFDLLDEQKESAVFEKLQKIVSNYGTITYSRIKRFNLCLIISHTPGAPKIKVEVNRRKFGSRYEMKTALGISMSVMVQEDMFANKLMAMLERVGKTSRDIFDVRFFAKNGWGINKNIVEQRAKMPFANVLAECIQLLEKMDNKHILDGLGELLTDAQKNSTRAKLKSDTIFALKLMLSNTKTVDSMPPYFNEEIEHIQRILNEKYFLGTIFFCKQLDIQKENVAWDKNGSDEDSYGYEIDCLLLKEGKKQSIDIAPMTEKVELEKAAHHIAFQVWAICDKNQHSPLYKKLLTTSSDSL